jgi:hypothetical protein
MCAPSTQLHQRHQQVILHRLAILNRRQVEAFQQEIGAA